MGFIALIIAIIALILAYKAYTRSGGNLEEVRADINDRLSTEKLRKTMADVLHKAEQSVRGDEQSQQDAETTSEDDSEDTKQ
jgi:hypothetical protein